MDPAVGDLRFAIGADDEERRHLALNDPARELDIDAAPVVVDRERPPRRRVAREAVAIVPCLSGWDHWRSGHCLSLRGGRLRIGPGDGGHIGAFARAQLDHVDAPVGGDDQIRRDVRLCRLHKNMDATGDARSALGVADDPARRVARSDRSGARQVFARLQRDVGDLAGGGIDLIERALAPGIDLDRVVIALAAWLDARGGIGILDTTCRRPRGSATARRCPGRRCVKRPWWRLGDGGWHRGKRRHLSVVANLWRPVGRAAGERQSGNQQKRRAGSAEAITSGSTEMISHCPISRDQLMALT